MSLPATPERLHGLDALRGFALLLGVALHASMSYLPGAEYFWITSDGDRSVVLGVAFHWVHSFRMTLFFLLAGYFGRLGLARLGMGAFIRDRFRRIVLPLLGFWWIVLMAIIAVIVWAAWLKNGGVMPEQPEQPPLSVRNFPLTHLWFLYLLSGGYAAMLGLRALFSALDRRGRLQRGLDAVVRVLGGSWAPLLASLPAALVLASVPGWWHWFGIPTPDMSLVPNAAAVVAYGMAFLGGWALHRHPPLLAALPKRWPLNLGLGVFATLLCLSQVGLVPPATPAAGGWPTLGYAWAYAIAGWAWSLALAGLALRFLGTHSPVRRYLADASYWVYLIHVPVVMAAQVLATRVDGPWWLEYPIALAACLAVLLLSYQVFVRHTWLGALLNGRRHPRRAAVRAPTLSQTA